MYTYNVGDEFLVIDFKVTATTSENYFIQSKNYSKEIGTITKREIHEDDGCEYYKLSFDDGYSITVGRFFLDKCKKFAN